MEEENRHLHWINTFKSHVYVLRHKLSLIPSVRRHLYDRVVVGVAHGVHDPVQVLDLKGQGINSKATGEVKLVAYRAFI